MSGECEHCKKLNEEVSYWRKNFVESSFPLNEKGRLIEMSFMSMPTDMLMQKGAVAAYMEIVRSVLREEE